MEVMELIAARAETEQGAWADVYSMYGPDNYPATLEDVYTYVKTWSRTFYGVAKNPNRDDVARTMARRWGAQYKEMAFLLRDALRKAA